MPTFARIASKADLPECGARETPTLDFKSEISKKPGKPVSFEAAKDIASFASVFGGVLLIGACEDSTTGMLSAWKTMPLTDAKNVSTIFQEAARDLCVPVPIVDPVPIPVKDGYVVAVNVEPVLAQPVGVRVRDGGRDDAYVFPARFSTHTIHLRADHLAMLMNPDRRRTMILLESIPAASRAQVRVWWRAYTDSSQRPKMTSGYYKILSMDWETNAIHVADVIPGAGGISYRIPIDDVNTVWQSDVSVWSIRVHGAFDNPSGRIEYVPRVS